MADLSKLTFNGVTYDLKDAVARETMAGAIKILGTTTTALTDEATTNPITVNSESVTAVQNDAVFYNSKEFVFDGTYWHEFGDMTGLGDLAQHDLDDIELETTVSQATAETTVSQATATTAVATTTNETATVAPAVSGETTYTPAGTITGTAIGYGAGESWNAVSVSVGGTSGETLIIATASEPTISTQGTFAGTGVRLETGNIAVPATFTTTVSAQTAETIVSAQTAETTAAYTS
jgi:hypothetical protein